jgi:hypothetical protein
MSMASRTKPVHQPNPYLGPRVVMGARVRREKRDQLTLQAESHGFPSVGAFLEYLADKVAAGEVPLPAPAHEPLGSGLSA